MAAPPASADVRTTRAPRREYFAPLRRESCRLAALVCAAPSLHCRAPLLTANLQSTRRKRGRGGEIEYLFAGEGSWYMYLVVHERNMYM